MKLDNYVDIKVFILYLMKNVGEPLEFTTVNDIVLQDEFVGYFDFAFCFSDLLDAGAIVSEENARKLRRLAAPRYQGTRSAQRPAADRLQPQRQPYHDGYQRGSGGVYARLPDRG